MYRPTLARAWSDPQYYPLYSPVGCAGFAKKKFRIDAKLMRNWICFASVSHVFCETKYTFFRIFRIVFSHQLFRIASFRNVSHTNFIVFRILFRIKRFFSNGLAIFSHQLFRFASFFAKNGLFRIASQFFRIKYSVLIVIFDFCSTTRI